MKVTQITQTNPDGSTTDYVVIDHGDGSFNSMTKAEYDLQQATTTEGVTP